MPRKKNIWRWDIVFVQLLKLFPLFHIQIWQKPPYKKGRNIPTIWQLYQVWPVSTPKFQRTAQMANFMDNLSSLIVIDTPENWFEVHHFELMWITPSRIREWKDRHSSWVDTAMHRLRLAWECTVWIDTLPFPTGKEANQLQRR